MILGCVLLFGTIFQAACGGESSTPVGTPGTPTGTYAITVTGTSGAIQHFSTIELTVQ